MVSHTACAPTVMLAHNPEMSSTPAVNMPEIVSHKLEKKPVIEVTGAACHDPDHPAKRAEDGQGDVQRSAERGDDPQHDAPSAAKD